MSAGLVQVIPASSSPPTAVRGQADSGARKDANEVLLKDGSQALQDLILSAEPYPIRGLFKCEPHSPAMMTCKAEPWVGWEADAPSRI